MSRSGAPTARSLLGQPEYGRARHRRFACPVTRITERARATTLRGFNGGGGWPSARDRSRRRAAQPLQGLDVPTPAACSPPHAPERLAPRRGVCASSSETTCACGVLATSPHLMAKTHEKPQETTGIARRPQRARTIGNRLQTSGFSRVARPLMVRKGSSVRVRWRALRKLAAGEPSSFSGRPGRGVTSTGRPMFDLRT